MAAPKPDLNSRSGAARHSKAQDDRLDAAIQAWEQASLRFTKLVTSTDRKKVRPAIVEEYRFAALVAYEAMLDAMQTATDALAILAAVRARRPPGKPNRNEI
uniref:Uncharacterized protein n=1 Tax=Caulobacter phage BL57 TaxID=3348355 RepID=A0AB74UJ65_9VIRU